MRFDGRGNEIRGTRQFARSSVWMCWKPSRLGTGIEAIPMEVKPCHSLVLWWLCCGQSVDRATSGLLKTRSALRPAILIHPDERPLGANCRMRTGVCGDRSCTISGLSVEPRGRPGRVAKALRSMWSRDQKTRLAQALRLQFASTNEPLDSQRKMCTINDGLLYTDRLIDRV